MTEENVFLQLQNGSDIRGVATAGYRDEKVTLTAQRAHTIARAFAFWLAQYARKECEQLTISVGMDSRLSGPSLKRAIVEGLKSSGVSVLSFGLCTTPAMFMSTVLPETKADGAIMITASHLPYNRNGIKFFTRDGGLEKADISAILAQSGQGFGEAARVRGHARRMDFLSVYARYLCAKIREGIQDASCYERPLTGLKICVDAGNGAGGFFVTHVLNALGANTGGSQFLQPDGHFPNHIPNPEDARAIAFVKEAVTQNACDLGIIFDTDVDRCAVVDVTGREINKSRFIALISAIVLRENPGASIVTDSVTSDELTNFINSHLGAVHRRFKRGYKNVIDEAVRLNQTGEVCPLAIETSGHGALRENYFLDDGAYMVAKILVEMARLKKEGKTITGLLEAYTDPKESVEFRLQIAARDFEGYGELVLRELLSCAKVKNWAIAPNSHEGVRVCFPEGEGGGWLLLRMSLHDPIMPLNIESSQVGGAAIIAEKLAAFLKPFEEIRITALSEWLEKQ